MISHYWFLNHGFKFQDCICNGCCYLRMLSLNIRDVATIAVKMLIIIELFITLADSKQLIDYKILCFKIVAIYKNANPRN